MPGKIKAETRYSNFEYNGWFAEPFFEPVKIYGSLGSVYAALKPLKIETSDVKYQGGATTPMDSLVIFQMPKNHYALNLSMAGITFKADYVDWSQAPIITSVIESCTSAIAQSLKTEIVRHQLQIVVQAVPAVSLTELTRRFAPSIDRPAKDIDFNGFILHTANGSFVLDKSAVNDGGIYIRIMRSFEGKTTMEEMAKKMYEEENWLADTLGIEIL
jgi:hypothetical protein